MSFWFWLGVGGVAWLLIGLVVMWFVGGAFRLGGDVPLREEPDLWGDLSGDTFDDWPPRVDDDRRAA